MKRNYKAVLFGNGTMGERHRKFFEYSGVQFLKIFDIEDLDSAGNVRASLVDEFISSEKIDFAVIASPATTHYEYAKLCLKRGISVFVEKPLATLGAQAQELVDLAIRNNVILFVAQSECFNSVFLNFRKHFMNEIGAAGSSFRLEFRREHKYSARCRDVNVALDLLVHDLSLCLSMFAYDDLNVEKFTISKNEDRAQMQISIVKGAYAGAELDFIVDRNSDIDVRTISVEFGGDGGPACDYSVSLAPNDENGEVIHVSDSLENEHKFFLKLMVGACSEWGRRAAQSAANAVKLATISTASS
ncbi:oxidoreductase domain protein [Fibrobacter succinogenes subsp. succinogenes S85]|nr:Gfo/Idh/MocA family oxidoreductase [Fibrobacter succinogenes]ACX75683.1 oxidoreductase domain protein [Fibrobacter succinogenes subsp. succinogenes S85]